MAEASVDIEPPNNDLYRKSAEKLIYDMLASQSYVHLSEKDLRDGGLISPEETLTDFAFREMRFGDSLQPEALEMFCNTAPPPVDTAEVNQWKNKDILSKDEEDEIRLSMLGVISEEKNNEIKQSEEMQSLINGIVSNARILELDGDKTADPEPYRKNIYTLMKLLKSNPETMTLNDQRCWGVRVPKDIQGGGVGLLGAMMMAQSVGNVIVVGDLDRNSELSTQVFSDKELLKHFVKEKIWQVHSQIKSNLVSKLSELSSKKYAEAKEAVKKINNPAQVGFFDRLLRDVEGKEIEIISILRDNRDVEIIEGKRPFSTDRVGSESGEIRLYVTKNENNELIFRLEDTEDKWVTAKRDGRNRRVMVSTPKTYRGIVKKEDGELRFNPYGDDGEWAEEPEYNDRGTYKAYELFEHIKLVTMDKWFKYGTENTEPVSKIMQSLDSCTSSVEYANKLRQLGVTHYPSTEIIVNPDSKVKYVLDESSPPPETAKFN